jgi:LPXTG-site transpeptidase (sortase) family protein
VVAVALVAVVLGATALLYASVPAVRDLFAPASTVRVAATPTAEATSSAEPTPAAAVPATLPPSPTFAIPVRLRIPKLGVDAPIDPVGDDKNGAMASPKGPTRAGWYELGTRPGERGSAVIAGHSGYRDGRVAIFDDLRKLAPGDAVTVIDKTGAEIAFVVREARQFDPEADAADVFARADDRYLNLITCTGAWSESSGTRAKRLVVFAVAVP